MFTRADDRAVSQLRDVTIETGWSAHAEGSAIVRFGDTKVLCTASFTQGVPRWLKGKNRGWVTAEYAMLPRATGERTGRESVRGKVSGRTQEISRLIGRSLRAVVDTKALGENTIVVDCDVIQADGGTRTAAITGAWVALAQAIEWAREQRIIRFDSGDLLEEAHHARRLLDDLGNTNTGIVVTSDLDEYAIAGLRSAPVDSYGVGTQLVTGSGAPTASLVYKLTTREDAHGNWVDVQKEAAGKASRGGRKYAARRMADDIAVAEVVVTGDEPNWDAHHRPLLVKVVEQGEVDTAHTGPSAVTAAAERHAHAVGELPPRARRLQDGEPAIPTEFELH